MKTFLLIAALAGALLGAAGTGLAQQQPAPSAAGEPKTCSQTAEYCKRGCEPHAGQGTRQCLLYCDTTLAECKATGFWKNRSNGQMLPRRKE